MDKAKTIFVAGASQGIADALLNLTETRSITGEVPNGDGGAHAEKW